MKTIHQSMNLAQQLNLWSFGLLFSLIPALCFGQDLPYSSASTGADGALFFSGTPGERYWHEMVYDSNRQVTVLFGNERSSGDDEIWEYDGATWSLVARWEEHRHNFAMAYDSARNVTVIFGGREAAGSFQSPTDNTTYEYDGTNVVQAVSGTVVPPQADHVMAYDVNRGVTVLLGSITGVGIGTWEYDGTSWSQIATADAPTGNNNAMVYDSVRQVIVVFSSNSTWEYDGVNWTNVSPSPSPSFRQWHDMVYDSNRNVIVLYSGNNQQNDTWEYDGATNTWTEISTATRPDVRHLHAMAYDSDRNVTVLYGGSRGSVRFSDTWEYDGVNWTEVESAASARTIDMNDKPDGIWNYTSIFVGQNVTVDFLPNAANAPVRWLATDDVVIDGTINLDGEDGFRNDSRLGGNHLNIAEPGPGGYAGGRGSNNSSSSINLGTPGLGPGGGAPGLLFFENNIISLAQSGTYFGNVFLQPLLGGSGGGGTSMIQQSGGNTGDTLSYGGGAGGGAILIDSSKDITIDGAITARGGSAGGGIPGSGSGGAIRLVADRIAGTGDLIATSRGGDAHDGRIRLEAYYRPFLAGNSTDPSASASAPVENPIPAGSEPQLVIASVDGVAVASPPTGDLSSADVVFSDAGLVDIVVNAINVPNGSTVDLNIYTLGQIISADPQILAGGTATFTVTVPAGIGHLQATSSFLPTP